jgi:UDP-glucose 4-epimerase
MEAGGISGQVFNVACGQRTSINDLLYSLQEISGRRIKPRFEPPRRGEVRHSISSIRLAQSKFNYEMKVGLQQGLIAAWRWFHEKGN